MFASQFPSSPRFSPIRIAVSAVVHAVALLLAISLRFASPAAPASARPTRTILLAPVPVAPAIVRPLPPRAELPPAPVSRPQPRAFVAPTPPAPTPTTTRMREAIIEASLPDHTPTAAPQLESRASVSLPPPPIVLGKLSSATIVTSAPPQRSGIAATSFDHAARPIVEEPARTARSAGFGDASVATGTQRNPVPIASKTTAVEILSKPRPLYTEEARRLRIEGEVLLEVLFSATGTARAERVIRGLGHGLDEAAAASVAAIQFRPAQRAGQPVDQLATVHITFQLAY